MNIKKILITFVTIICAFTIFIFVTAENNKLICTRNNNDEVVFVLDKEGVKKMTINDVEESKEQIVTYNIKLVLGFMNAESIQDVKKVVKNYEIGHGSTCN